MVGNLFIRLYLLVVISIVTIGIGTNWIWINYIEQPKIASSQSQGELGLSPTNQYDLLIRAVAIQLKNVDTILLNERLTELNNILSLEFTTLDYDQLPIDLFKNVAKATSPILLLLDDGETLNESTDAVFPLALFLPLTGHKKYLQLKVPGSIIKGNQINSTDGESQRWLLVVFYLLVAVTIFYWIWPLSKDLTRLQNAVKNFDNEYWNAKVDIPATSSISHLATAYNHLLNKIKRLVENEKAMANSISHELRTPLARVRFALQMAKETDNSTLATKQIISAEEDIEEMNQLIAELLNYASIENQAFGANFSKGDLGALIAATSERLQKNYPAIDISFTNELFEDKISCDEILMERAIQNLTINACKYGAGTVKIKLFSQDGNYHVSVSNNGNPIEAGEKKLIFDAFYQVSSKERSKGFGLGLSTVRRIAQLHSGKVTVTKSKMGGAEFIIYWPRELRVASTNS